MIVARMFLILSPPKAQFKLVSIYIYIYIYLCIDRYRYKHFFKLKLYHAVVDQ